MTSKDGNFTQMRSISKPLNLANGEIVNICGIGEIQLKTFNGRNTNNTTLKDVMYVPSLHTNLLSVAKITDKGFEVKFTEKRAYILDKNGVIITVADRKGDLFYIRKPPHIANLIKSENNNVMTWHQRLGHLNFKYLFEMYKLGMVQGITLDETNEKINCNICIEAEQTQSPFPKGKVERSSEMLNIVHSDVCGPMRTQSMGGSLFFVTFIDDLSLKNLRRQLSYIVVPR